MAKLQLHIATITAAHGIRGEVKLRTLMNDPDTVFQRGPVSDEIGQRQFKIKRQGQGSNGVFIVAIEGINDRNEAELLKGTKLFAPEDALPAKAANQWYYRELIGLEARLADGRVYGKVAAVHNFGAGDLLDIELTQGGTEMLPFKKPFVGDVHADEGYLLAFPPEYIGEKEKE